MIDKAVSFKKKTTSIKKILHKNATETHAILILFGSVYLSVLISQIRGIVPAKNSISCKIFLILSILFSYGFLNIINTNKMK